MPFVQQPSQETNHPAKGFEQHNLVLKANSFHFDLECPN